MLLIYTVVFWISIILYFMQHNIIASGLMIALAIFLYAIEFKKNQRIITIRGLFAVGFIGGFGLSLLKLSALSSPYSLMTIFTVFVCYFAIYLGTYFFKNVNLETSKIYDLVMSRKVFCRKQEFLVVILMIVTFVSFLIEAYIVGFVPVFTVATPHAYSTFHVFMLHYITSLYVLIPSAAIVNYYTCSNKDRAKVIVIISYIYVLSMAILLVSRAQFTMGIVLSIFVILMQIKTLDVTKIKRIKFSIMIAIAVLFIIAIYLFITIKRAHNVEYLNEIFEMKDTSMPIYFTQPYMYVAHNFENLNYLINNVARFSFGRRMLMPFFTLTLIKRFFPLVVATPVYIIKEELTAKTLIYDAYYDFGIVGVIMFCFLIGFIGKLFEDLAYKIVETKVCSRINYIVLIFALLSYYILFSFFQTYFSLTDTWVMLILLSGVALL